MPRPTADQFQPYYQRYIDKATGETIADVQKNHAQQILDFFNSIPETKADHAYAEGKWTIKQLVQHLLDAERVFVYRAMRFARKDSLPLQGFDEDMYANNATCANRNLKDLLEELKALRLSTDIFLRSLTDEQLSAVGTANNTTMSVNAIAFVTYGHLLHHMGVVQERYL
jgi:uncharacterized damage-inducible protein DinB